MPIKPKLNFTIAWRLRNEDGVGIVDRAKQIGVSTATLSHLENGFDLAPKRGHSSTLDAIEKFYGLSIERLQQPMVVNLPMVRYKTSYRRRSVRKKAVRK